MYFFANYQTEEWCGKGSGYHQCLCPPCWRQTRALRVQTQVSHSPEKSSSGFVTRGYVSNKIQLNSLELIIS